MDKVGATPTGRLKNWISAISVSMTGSLFQTKMVANGPYWQPHCVRSPNPPGPAEKFHGLKDPEKRYRQR
ncbi:MAG: hypothetical protein R2860_09950 [Desulfobacterales bacterium]